MEPKWSISKLPSSSGKVAIITGSNSGIGYEVALALALKDFVVILACRDMQKAISARDRITALHPQSSVTPMKVDLSRLADVKRFAEEFKKKFQRLDLLINNAGIMMSPYELTEDGFENQFATNYIGHFALTGLLLPKLINIPGSRVVTLSSLSYKWAELQFQDLHFRKQYSRRKAYGQSKRACLMFSFELQRRFNSNGHSTLSIAAHPGLSKTNLDQYFPSLIRPLGNLFLQPALMGALPVLYAALDPSIRGGEFIGPDGFQELRGYPTRVTADAYSYDPSIAKRLWDISQQMTNVAYL